MIIELVDLYSSATRVLSHSMVADYQSTNRKRRMPKRSLVAYLILGSLGIRCFGMNELDRTCEVEIADLPNMVSPTTFVTPERVTNDH